eukprot:COSAG05_NODE_3217_length_2230_cov_1.925387_1_plen_465_part_00
MLKVLRGATERKWPYVRKCRVSTIGVDLFIWLHQDTNVWFLSTTNVTYWGTVLGSNEGVHVLFVTIMAVSTKPLLARILFRSRVRAWQYCMRFLRRSGCASQWQTAAADDVQFGSVTMVDYSKWDNLDLGSDSEDERPPAPRITRYEPGSTITVGPNGHSLKSGPPATAATKAAVRFGPAEAAKPAAAAPRAHAAKHANYSTDYSKWDSLEVSESEEEEDPDAMDGEYDDEELEAVERAKEWTKRQETTAAEASAEALREYKKAEVASASAASAAPAEVGGGHAAVKNGGHTKRYLWSQEPDEVVVAVAVPPGTRASAVVVELVDASPAPRLAVGLRDDVGGTTWLVNEALSHKVAVTDDSSDVDWEVRDLPTEYQDGWNVYAGGRCHTGADAGVWRAVTVTLKKEAPAGVVIWWKAVMKGDPEIDTSKIAGRRNNSAAQSAWQDAHAEFLKKVANRQPVEINA